MVIAFCSLDHISFLLPWKDVWVGTQYMCFRHPRFCPLCPRHLTSESFSDQEFNIWSVAGFGGPLGIAADSPVLRDVSSAVLSPASALFPGPLSLTVPSAWQGHLGLLQPERPADLCFSGSWATAWWASEKGCRLFYFFSSTTVGLNRCSRGFLEAYNVYVFFHQQRLWLCKSKQCCLVEYFLVQFSVALEGDCIVLHRRGR